jgi:hypothetical protein
MISVTVMIVAILAGYVVVVGVTLAVTLAMGSSAPESVVVEHRVRRRFKVTQDLVWLASAALGGFVAALIAGTVRPWMVAALLMAALVLVLWKNTWEARQRGLTHQILITLASVVGVGIGFLLKMKFLPTW